MFLWLLVHSDFHDAMRLSVFVPWDMCSLLFAGWQRFVRNTPELIRYCLATPPTSVVGDALHRVRFGEFVSLWVHRASRNRKGRGANERDLADAHLRTGSCGWLFVSAE